MNKCFIKSRIQISKKIEKYPQPNYEPKVNVKDTIRKHYLSLQMAEFWD